MESVRVTFDGMVGLGDGMNDFIKAAPIQLLAAAALGYETAKKAGIEVTPPDLDSMKKLAEAFGPEGRDPSFADMDVFMAEVGEWATRNFGVRVGEGRSGALEALLDRVRSMQGEMFDVQIAAELISMAYAVDNAPAETWPHRPLLGSVEELGELAHAHLKGEQGIRLTPEEVVEKKKDAIGDVLVYLAHYMYLERMSFYECIERAWGEVRERDWKKNTLDGKVT
jgi:NTP pyrophosphatase (non-canonical NTP hydrolase)